MENSIHYDDNEALAEEVDDRLDQLEDLASEEASDEEDSALPQILNDENIEANTEVQSLKKIRSDKSLKQPREKIIMNIAGFHLAFISI